MNMKLSVCVLAGLVLLGFGGCEPAQRSMVGRMRTPQEGMITKEELRELLNSYRDYYVAELKRIGEQIDTQNGARRTQRISLQMRMRIISAIDTMLEPSDPVVAFLEIWGFTLRMRLYLEQGDGMHLYGEQQSVVVDFTRRVEEEIERIARLFLDEQKYREAYDNLMDFARRNPIRGTYSNLVVMATKEQKEGPNPLMNVVTIPMAPFSAMRGVDRTADAVYQFRNTAERFTDVVRDLPEMMHWEAQLFMDEWAGSEQMQSLLTSLERFSESSVRLSAAAERLTDMLEEDSSQTALNQALVSARETAGEVRAAIESMDKTGRTLRETAAEVARAAEAARALVEPFMVRSERDPQAGPPFTMRDFNDLVSNIGRTADQIHQVVQSLQQMPQTQDQITRQINASVDHAAKRILQLLLVLFVLMLGYHILTRRKKTPADS
ncbi:MAG TPA: hypothetical protein PK054_00485 [Anaerohalosphaeraceae bacterium]|nr:hypothetical protein [Anaerohalosphaeraceae bacterium]HOL88387.1 hypothetical protein [Anaerohalosphaeraceae bacterium]HPP55039.1 hypothetical protein [Anaerohalosphaeraceae bacterium]